ncbi:MAG: PDZ domain-containing protein [Magnetococcales bacterium]|nr:PDZ domain-containing protein [Magnetococcales bacterium]
MTRFALRLPLSLSLLALSVASPVQAGGWLGITVQPPEGVQIGEILKDGPADKAGLARQDILIKADGKTITSIPQFLALVASATPNKEMVLTIIRKGEEKQIKITPEESRDHPSRFPEGHAMPLQEPMAPMMGYSSPHPDLRPQNTPPPAMDRGRELLPPAAAMPPPAKEQRPSDPPEPPPTVWLGVAPELAANGVLLARIAPGGPGERAGMQAGDVIISLNGKSVSTPWAMARTLRGFQPGDLVEVTLNRNGQMIDTQAQLAAPPTETP